MKKLFTCAMLTICLVVNPAFAKVAFAERANAAIMPATGCMTENASINISINGTETDVSTVSSKFDTKRAEIEKQFAAAKLTKFELQSMNYNINPNGQMGYQFSGNYSYVVVPANKATLLMAELTKKGYQASVNVNAYRNGGAPCPVNE